MKSLLNGLHCVAVISADCQNVTCNPLSSASLSLSFNNKNNKFSASLSSQHKLLPPLRNPLTTKFHRPLRDISRSNSDLKTAVKVGGAFICPPAASQAIRVAG